MSNQLSKAAGPPQIPHGFGSLVSLGDCSGFLPFMRSTAGVPTANRKKWRRSNLCLPPSQFDTEPTFETTCETTLGLKSPFKLLELAFGDD